MRVERIVAIRLHTSRTLCRRQYPLPQAVHPARSAVPPARGRGAGGLRSSTRIPKG